MSIVSRSGFLVVLVPIVFAGVFLFARGGRSHIGSSSTLEVQAEATPSPTPELNKSLSYQVQSEKQAAVDDGGDLRPLTTPQVVELSTRIIMAKCLTVSVREASGGIFTFSEFEVLEVLKGKLQGKNLTLRLYGGRLGNIEIDSSSMPQFAAGEEVILSLGSDNLHGYPTIFPQGTFRIALDPQSHQRVVVTRPNGLPMFRAKDKQPYSGSPPIPLEDFLFSLQKLIDDK
jgi:hypothetical protein